MHGEWRREEEVLQNEQFHQFRRKLEEELGNQMKRVFLEFQFVPLP